MAALPGPRGFARDWPLHLVSEPGAFYLWWIPPNVIVTQGTLDTLTLPFAREQLAFVDAVRWRRHAAIRAAGGLRVFNDWSSVAKADGAARSLISESFKTNVHKGDMQQIVTAMQVNSMIRMAFAVVNIAASFTSTTENRLVEDVTPWIEALPQGPAPDEPLDEDRAFAARRNRGEQVAPVRPV